jgi:uncharacterized protein (UPF0332 family)
MASVPPLPEPGFQSPDDRRNIARRFILEAREELERGSRLQAGEKAWGAIAHNLKVIGESRGWNHQNHQQVQNIGRQIVREYENTRLGEAIADAYHTGHVNFYENQWSFDTIRETIEAAEEALPELEALQQTAPRPFTITSNRELRRLIALTGNDQLRVGDTSPVGFSLRHTPDSTGGGEEGAGPLQPDGTPSP